jgi:hypothetical protein
LGDAGSIVPAHHPSQQNGQQSRCICSLLFVCLLPWWLLGQYRMSSCLMAVSSGFLASPGHAALCNAIFIAPMHCHGHQNGQQQRNILMLLLISSSTITIA